MAQITHYLGIDGGGTKTEFALADTAGNIINSLTLGPSNPNDIGMNACLAIIDEGIRTMCADRDIQSISLFAGLAGGISGNNRQLIADHLSTYGFGKIGNDSDARNAVAVCLGEEDGIAIILGTGAIAFAQKQGVLYRVGGYGYLFGDEGSGFAIGRDAILAALQHEAGYGTSTLLTEAVLRKCATPTVLDALASFYSGGKRLVASYAPLVFEAAQKDDPVATDIIRRNMAAISRLIGAAVKVSELAPPVRAVLCGGITHHQDVITPIISQELSVNVINAHPDICTQPMVLGALRLAGARV